ncbi:Galactose oxidase [Dorcoceras hygrometricum]|uniref:Galactose oxidase n=1 Tax=Dorcoceras hygrometricum TaxID=472368 RepID=A0A2Z6ZXH0_9LAMI|nr:Galactose oxidase [Dorcoceras hygrometricum]
MTFRVARTNQYNQDLGLFHSTNGNHLESPKEGSSIDHQPDEGVSDLVVDRIGDNLPQSTEKSRILVIPVGARHKCQQAGGGSGSLTVVSEPGFSDLIIRIAIIVSNILFFRIETKTESKFRLESPPHTAAPHRAHEHARYMRAGRAWMGAAPRYHREMVRRCWPGRTRCLALLVARDTTSGRALATKLGPLPQAMAALNSAQAARFLFAGRSLCGVRGRAMEVLVDVARAALRCVAFRAMVRALPLRFSWWRRRRRRPPLRRRSGEFSAMS